MRSRSFGISIFIIVLLFALAACQTPEPLPTRPSSEQTIIALIQTITAQASEVSGSAIPIGLSATDTPSAPIAVLTETPSVPTALPQATLEASATPYVPPTITVTASPSVPQVSVSSVTNCRTGPSPYYKLVTQANVGTNFILVGKHTQTGYWIIRLTDGRECWLWGQHATVEGNIDSLPEYAQPAVGKLEGELWKSSAPDAGRIDNAFVNIGLGFQEYKTGQDGKFIFEDVPAGEVVVKVRHDYFMVPTFQVFVNSGQSTPVIKIGFVLYNYPLPPTLTPTPSCHIFWPKCNIIILPTLRAFP